MAYAEEDRARKKAPMKYKLPTTEIRSPYSFSNIEKTNVPCPDMSVTFNSTGTGTKDVQVEAVRTRPFEGRTRNPHTPEATHSNICCTAVYTDEKNLERCREKDAEKNQRAK